MPDNMRFDVNGEGIQRLKTALSLAPKNKAIGYAVTPENRFVLFWDEDEGMTPFPSPLSIERAAELAFDWLQTADYGRQPDHDGDNEEGWRAFNEPWGHVQPYGWKAFAAVEPCWMMYGK